MTWHIEQWDVAKTPWPVDDESVQCVVTSPPYWGLRDYGTATWEGGSAECNHLERTAEEIGKSSTLNFGMVKPDNQAFAARELQYRETCGKCGARRIDAQIGLEKSPEEYVDKMVAVFREVRRVLRNDGTVWLNLGDSFFSKTKGSIGNSDKQVSNAGSRRFNAWSSLLKDKDLVGIPWRVAFALHADGWWLRSDIVWAKPNPMPESITDRPTRAHEYVFLLAKAARYFYDADAIRQPLTDGSIARLSQPTFEQQTGGPKDSLTGNRSCRKTLENMRHNMARRTSQESANRVFEDPEAMARIIAQGANARTVWSIASEPYAEAHFATFPTALARRCILAGSRPGDLVLDPFSGAGTVALVSDIHGRNAIGLELNPKYIEMSRKRILAPRSEPEAERRDRENAGQSSFFDILDNTT